jgi:putative Holliday junction resolvase
VTTSSDETATPGDTGLPDDAVFAGPGALPRAPRGAVVAVDFGEKRSGLAACDALRIAAVPIGVVETSDREVLLERIVDAVDERSATTVIVGLPLHMAGHASERSRRVLALCEELRRRLPHVDVATWDERLTTREATHLLTQGGLRGKQRKAHVDEVAAVVILRSYLSSATGGG